jgi:hypothetical protein
MHLPLSIAIVRGLVCVVRVTEAASFLYPARERVAEIHDGNAEKGPTRAWNSYLFVTF